MKKYLHYLLGGSLSLMALIGVLSVWEVGFGEDVTQKTLATLGIVLIASIIGLIGKKLK